MNIFNFLFPLKLKSSAKTDKGKKRAHNEDSILADEKQNLFIVADGIGGHGNGKYASQESIKILNQQLFSNKKSSNNKPQTDKLNEQLSQINFENASDIGTVKFPQLNHLLDAIFLANEKIYSENQANINIDKKRGMGTTFSGCWFLPKQKKVILFNIGDSRIYLLRKNNLSQRTHDHSMRQHWIDNGEQGPKPPANIILRAIGPRPQVEADIELADIERGDTWLICSDGLHGMLSDKIIEEFLCNRVKDKNISNFQNFSPRLVDKANYAGGLDNISVIIIHVV
ncbi:MAG: protein phosphatase 2C domain-containing protein [Pseudomonadota bacterium]